MHEKIRKVLEAPLEKRGYGFVAAVFRAGSPGRRKDRLRSGRFEKFGKSERAERPGKFKKGQSATVEIYIDRLDNEPVSVDDCAAASRLISAILDVENFIIGPYNLSISSPGEERPLTRINDYERFCGENIKIELCSAVNGRKKIDGRLMKMEVNCDDAVVYLKEECNNSDALIDLSYKNIKKASIKRSFSAE
jgi:ribosome maturation factor RimP